MSKWLAAFAVIALTLVATFAQDANDNPPNRFPFNSSTNLPWNTIEKNNGTAWNVIGSGQVTVETLVAGLCTARSKTFSYSQRAAASAKDRVPFVAPEKGMIIESPDLTSFTSDLLSATGLTLIGLSNSHGRVVTVKEAFSEAAYVSAADLANLDKADWSTVLINLSHSNANAISRSLSNLQSNNYNMNLSPTPSGVIVVGQVRRLLEITALIKDLDQPGTGDNNDTVRSYDLLAGVKAATAKNLLGSLFPSSSTQVKNVENGVEVHRTSRERISVGLTASDSRIVVRATLADHELVKQALEAIK